MRNKFITFLATLGFSALPFAAFAADSNISSVSSQVSDTSLGATSTHTVNFTTATELTSGSSLYMLYTGSVSPQDTGISFADAEFFEEEANLNAEFTTIGDGDFIVQITLTDNLPAATYDFTISGASNPTASVDVYASMTTEEVGQSANFTTDGNGVSFGEGGGSCEDPGSVQVANAAVKVLGENLYLTWDEYEGAAGYFVTLSTDEEFNESTGEDVGTATEHWLTGLDAKTAYYIDIRADDESRCRIASAQLETTTEKKLENQKPKKTEFTFPKKKRKVKKFNIKFAAKEKAHVSKVQYQVFKGKKASKAKRIGKKVRKTSKKAGAVTVSGKQIKAETYYWVRMRKVYTIDGETVTTKYSAKKRVKTKAAATE